MTSSHGSWWLRRVRGALALLAATAVHVGAQQSTITGVVTDSANSRPVTDVRVFVVGTNLVGTTNADGRYTLRGAPA